MTHTEQSEPAPASSEGKPRVTLKTSEGGVKIIAPEQPATSEENSDAHA